MDALIMKSKCVECKKIIACYVSYRTPRRVECHNCDGISCPSPTLEDSHGFCANCLKSIMKKDEEIQMIGLS